MAEHEDKKRAPNSDEDGAESVDFDVQVEPEVGAGFEIEDELGDIVAAQAKLKKLKDELAKIKAERQEFLDGWQRCKADSVNMRKETLAGAERLGTIAKENLIEDIIPALDGFDIAVGTPLWESVDPSWRDGIDQIRNQLLDALLRHGVERFGKIGDPFDPRLHEVAEEVDNSAGEPGTVVRILRHGYRMNDRTLRPAHVVIKSSGNE